MVGESLVDEVVTPGGERRSHPGGSPLNVAVGLARLERSVGLLTRWGDDAYGALLAAHATDNGVALVGDPVDGHPTSVAEATLDAQGAASYAFSLHWDLPRAAEPPTGAELRAVHTGSIAAVVDPGAGRVRALLESLRGRASVSYDPNCRPVLMGESTQAATRIEELVALADVVKASSDDLEWLYPDRSWVDSGRAWLAAGPSLVVVTRSGEGAWAACAAGELDRPPVPVDLVDTVGAGDAFEAGLLDGFLRAGLLGAAQRPALRRVDLGTLATVLERAGLVAAVTVSRPGADPPTAAELAGRPAAGAAAGDDGT